MLGNLVNADDVAAVGRRLRRADLGVVRRLLASDEEKVKGAWEHLEGEPTHWFDVPPVLERQRRLATGSADRDHVSYLADRYLAGRSRLLGLSIGCGTGWRELVWGRTGVFERLDGYDVVESRITHAREAAVAEGLDGVLSFAVADAYALEVPAGSLDVVIVEDALHHLTPVDEILTRVRTWLRPDGYLFVNEFVGPRRFQWTERQVEAANALLALLPEHLRRSWRSGVIRRRVARPSLVRMRALDPSEAVESDRILPAIHEQFDVVEVRPLGGTIVNLVLEDIAHHFLNGDVEAARFLRLAFETEDALLAAGELESDHALVVCRRPAEAAS